MGAAGGVDNMEGSLNIGRERTIAYGDKAEFAEFEVNRIVEEGEVSARARYQ